MSNQKSRQKRQRCLEHRKERYEHYLDNLMNGQAKPEDVTLRFKKLKEVKG